MNNGEMVDKLVRDGDGLAHKDESIREACGREMCNASSIAQFVIRYPMPAAWDAVLVLYQAIPD